MRIDATVVEEAIRVALDELGLAADPIMVEVPSEGSDHFLSEDRDATEIQGIAVFLVPPEYPGDVDQYILQPEPDGNVELAEVDQDLRAIRLGRVADLVWERLSAELSVTVDELLAFED
jgi:hypothetical protein